MGVSCHLAFAKAAHAPWKSGSRTQQDCCCKLLGQAAFDLRSVNKPRGKPPSVPSTVPSDLVNTVPVLNQETAGVIRQPLPYKTYRRKLQTPLLSLRRRGGKVLSTEMSVSGCFRVPWLSLFGPPLHVAWKIGRHLQLACRTGS